MLDLFMLTIEDMTRHLKAIDNRKLSPVELTTAGFLLTEEQWRAHQGEWKKREASGSLSGVHIDHARRTRERIHVCVGATAAMMTASEKRIEMTPIVTVVRLSIGPRTACGRRWQSSPCHQGSRR